MRRRLVPSIARSASILVLVILALSPGAVRAHPGHPHDDGRIPGQPDFQRIGTNEFEFHPKAHAYTHKRSPNGVPLWFHVDDFAPSGFAPGALYDLPTSTEQPVCASSGHRVKIAYAETYTKWKSQDPYMTIADREAIRNAVLRMNWKIKNESLRSSDGETALRMRVDCDGLGQINVSEFVVFSYPYNDPNSVFAEASQVLGAPSGANAIKHLIFFDGPGPVDINGNTASGFGEGGSDSLKSSSDGSGGNYNRITTASAVIYNPAWPDPMGYWDSHVTLHELFHTMGAVNFSAPFATGARHCTDGIDVMCYPDASPEGPTYTESRCPFPGYGSPIGTPLDCEYNTYFDVDEESKEWLNTNWNIGGVENPFLVQSTSPPPMCDPLSKSRIKIGDMNGDSRADIFSFTPDPGDNTGAGRVWRSEGTTEAPTYTALGQVSTGFGRASEDRLADWDGDADDDIFQFTEYGRLDGWRSNGTGYTPLSQVGSDFPHPCRVRIGDMNGDGKDDIFRVANNENGYAWLSTGTPTGYSYKGLIGTGFGLSHQVRVVDMDGDGDDDLFKFLDNGNAYAWRSNKTSYTYLGLIATGFGNSAQVRVGDRDGDGDDDLFQFTEDGKGYYWRSNGTSYTYLGIFTSGFGPAGQVRIADINGDSKSDILYFSNDGTAQAWLGDGTSWKPLNQIGSGFGVP